MINFLEQFNNSFYIFSQTMHIYEVNNTPSYIVFLVVLIFFLSVAFLARFLIKMIFTVIAKKTKTDVDDKIIKALGAPIFFSIILLGISQSILFSGFFSEYYETIAKFLETVFIAIWVYASAKILTIFIKNVGFKIASKTKSTMDDELMPLFQKIGNLLVYFVGIMLIFKAWNIDITPFLASAGILGFIVAFAAQDTISHLFGGISLYFDKAFKVGDRVQLESGEIGNVIEIGIRSTRIKTFDETVLIIPNSKVANSRIINYNQPKSSIKVKLTISVSYNSDIEKVKRTLFGVIERIDEIKKEPPPSIFLLELGEFSLKFIIVAWVDSPGNQFLAKTKMNEEIYKAFKKEGIVIPYPSQDIYLRK